MATIITGITERHEVVNVLCSNPDEAVREGNKVARNYGRRGWKCECVGAVEAVKQLAHMVDTGDRYTSRGASMTLMSYTDYSDTVVYQPVIFPRPPVEDD